MKHLIFDETETIHLSQLTLNNFVIAKRHGKIVATITINSSSYNVFTNGGDIGETFDNFTKLLDGFNLTDCELLVYEICP
jgi:hypothetical protein